jgi:hypothetical protein
MRPTEQPSRYPTMWPSREPSREPTMDPTVPPVRTFTRGIRHFLMRVSMNARYSCADNVAVHRAYGCTDGVPIDAANALSFALSHGVSDRNSDSLPN